MALIRVTIKASMSRLKPLSSRAHGTGTWVVLPHAPQDTRGTDGLRRYHARTTPRLKRLGQSESKLGPRHRLFSPFAAWFPGGATRSLPCEGSVSARLLAEPDLACYTIRLPA